MPTITLTPAVDSHWLEECFTMAAAEVKDFSTTPEAVLTRFGRRVAVAAAQLVLLNVQQLVEQEAAAAALRYSFYFKYPDLVGHEDVVGRSIAVIHRENPDALWEKLLLLIAQRARAELAGYRELADRPGGGYL